MLTGFKKIFTWWNVDTLWNKELKTILFGKFVGSDSLVINIMKAKMVSDG